MPCRHHPVSRELVGTAIVTGQAQIGAWPQVGGRIHAARDILLVGRSLGSMRGQPILRAAMARFAADPVGEREFLTPLWGRHVVSMTVQALFRGGRIADT